MSEEQISPACAQIFDWVNEQLGRKEVGTANRASSAPQCVRKRWMQNKGIEGEAMQPRSLVVFATGDVVEHVMKYFIANACVGPDKLYSEVDLGEKQGTFVIQHREFDIYKQETVTASLTLGGKILEIPGHGDGWGKRNSDGEWEYIEVKSASSLSFDYFVKGECDYVEQAHAIMMTDKAKRLGVKSTRFFYMNKNTSAIFDRLYEFDAEIAKRVIREYFVSNGDAMPLVPEDDAIGPQAITYRSKPTGEYKLGWKCSYCEYREKCWPEARLEFKGGKPIYYIDSYLKGVVNE